MAFLYSHSTRTSTFQDFKQAVKPPEWLSEGYLFGLTEIAY